MNVAPVRPLNAVAAGTSTSKKLTRDPWATKASTSDAPIPEAPPVMSTEQFSSERYFTES